MIGKILCSIAKAFGGCKPDIPQPEDIGEVKSRNPKTTKPSKDWTNGIMPTYNIRDLIDHLEYRASIHLTYSKLLEEGRTEYLGFGSIEFHDWAIEGYENSVFYLRRLQ